MECLYSKIMGPHWDDLHPSVRQLHSFQNGSLFARGRFSICRGKKFITRWVAWLLRMPRANHDAKVFLELREEKHGEAWVRNFDGRIYPSTQSAISDGMLSERMGILEFHFMLKGENGCLRYLKKSVGLRIFGKSIPMPGWLSPGIVASECPAEEAGLCKINVEIHFPLLGTLLKYGGLLRRVEA